MKSISFLNYVFVTGPTGLVIVNKLKQKIVFKANHMKTLLLFLFASIGMLTEVPEVCAGCIVFVALLLCVKPSK